MKDLQFVPNHRRIRAGLDALMESFYAGRYPFSRGDMEFPQDEVNMPVDLPRGGVEEAHYWVWVCNYMLGATDSMMMARHVAFKLYPRYRELLFNWDSLEKQSPAAVSKMLQDAELKFRSSEDEIPKGAIENAKRINKRWDGNILNAFEEAGTSWRKLYRLLKATKKGEGLVGYRDKMVSMLAFYLMRRKIVPYFPMPPQVDFHVMRVFWSCNMVVPSKLNGEEVSELKAHVIPKFAEAISEILYDYILETNCNWLDLSDALWTQSRVRCKLSPSNSMSRGKDAEMVLKKPIVWSDNMIKRFKNSCEGCELALMCTSAISHGHYYGEGPTLLKIVGPREEPPGRRLF